MKKSEEQNGLSGFSKCIKRAKEAMEEIKRGWGQRSFLGKIIFSHNKLIVMLFLLGLVLCIFLLIEGGVWIEEGLYVVYGREGGGKYEKILKEYASESDIYIIISGGRRNVEAYGYDIAEKLNQAKEFREIIKEVNIYNNDLEFLRRHGFKVWDKEYVDKAVELYKPRGFLEYLKSYTASYEEGLYNGGGRGRFGMGLYEELKRVRRLLVILLEYIEEPEGISAEGAGEELAEVALFGERLEVGVFGDYLLLRVGVHIIDRHEGREQIKKVLNYVRAESKEVEGLKIYSEGARGYYEEEGKLTSYNPLVIFLLLELIFLLNIILWKGFKWWALYVISSQIQLLVYMLYITKELLEELNVLGVLVILVLNIYSYVTGLRISIEYEKQRKMVGGLRATLERLLKYKGKRFILFSISLCGFYLVVLQQGSEVVKELGVLVFCGLLLNMVLVIFYLPSLHLLVDKFRLRRRLIYGLGRARGGEDLLSKVCGKFLGDELGGKGVRVGLSGYRLFSILLILSLILVVVWLLLNKGEERYKDLGGRVYGSMVLWGGDKDGAKAEAAKILHDRFKIGEVEYLLREGRVGGVGFGGFKGEGLWGWGYRLDSIRAYLPNERIQSINLSNTRELKKFLEGGKEGGGGFVLGGEVGAEDIKGVLRGLIRRTDEVVSKVLGEGNDGKLNRLRDDIVELGELVEGMLVLMGDDVGVIIRLSKSFKKAMGEGVMRLLEDMEFLTFERLGGDIRRRYINEGGEELIRFKDGGVQVSGFNGGGFRLREVDIFEKLEGIGFEHISKRLLLEEGKAKVLEGSIKWFWYGHVVLFLLFLLGRRVKEGILLIILFLFISLLQLGIQEFNGVKYNYINYVLQMVLILLGYNYIFSWLEIEFMSRVWFLGVGKDGLGLKGLVIRGGLEELLMIHVVVIVNVVLLYLLLESRWQESLMIVPLLWMLVYLLIGIGHLLFNKNGVES